LGTYLFHIEMNLASRERTRHHEFWAGRRKLQGSNGRTLWQKENGTWRKTVLASYSSIWMINFHFYSSRYYRLIPTLTKGNLTLSCKRIIYDEWHACTCSANTVACLMSHFLFSWKCFLFVCTCVSILTQLWYTRIQNFWSFYNSFKRGFEPYLRK